MQPPGCGRANAPRGSAPAPAAQPVPGRDSGRDSTAGFAKIEDDVGDSRADYLDSLQIAGSYPQLLDSSFSNRRFRTVRSRKLGRPPGSAPLPPWAVPLVFRLMLATSQTGSACACCALLERYAAQNTSSNAPQLRGSRFAIG